MTTKTKEQQPVGQASAIEESVTNALATRDSGLVMFGQLPKELAFLKGYKIAEKVGVVPAWKPTEVGDVLAGQVIEYKVHPHKTYDTDLVVIQGPTGVFSVWLTSDLARKIGKDMAERKAIVAIRYEGSIPTPSGPHAGKPMHSYQVIEVLAKA